MLKHLTYHYEFKHQLKLFRDSLSDSDKKRLRSPDFKSALFKVLHLDLDVIHDHIEKLYSSTGRPAEHQIEIFRSLLLMLHFGYTSIRKWKELLDSDSLYAALCGLFNGDSIPLGSYYDFMNRLYLDKEYNQLYSKDRYKKPSKKLKKGEKLNNVQTGKTKELYEKYVNGASDDDRPEIILHKIFKALAIDTSDSLGLLDSEGIIASGDGSAAWVHASPFGHKVDGQPDDIRRYSDPSANIGWDSDKTAYYFGYSTYFLATHVIKDGKAFDLPLQFNLVPASQHDSITVFSSLAQFRALNHDIKINHLCLDSAHDNQSTFKLCHEWNINPVIDLNKRGKGHKKYNDEFTIDENGTPVCKNNVPMTYDGYSKDRHRFKFRCPLATGKIKECPFKDKCSDSPYGRTVYIYSTKDDPRWQSEIRYKSKKWKEIYKERTSCERINNRVLNNYNLQNTFMRTKRRLYFLQMLCCIHIHADAWMDLIN